MKRFMKNLSGRWTLAAVFAGLLSTGAAAAAPPEIRLYTLDCGLTEFKDADVFSDTGEYEGKYLALPTPCYLIRHGKDWLLWDTGLSDKLAAEPHGKEIFGGRFSVKRTLAAQLAALGLPPKNWLRRAPESRLSASIPPRSRRWKRPGSSPSNSTTTCSATARSGCSRPPATPTATAR